MNDGEVTDRTRRTRAVAFYALTGALLLASIGGQGSRRTAQMIGMIDDARQIGVMEMHAHGNAMLASIETPLRRLIHAGHACPVT